MSPNLRNWLVIACITSIALLLRITNIDRMSLWGDEACMVFLCSESPTTIINALASADRPDVDVAPPVYFMALHYWMSIFGDSLTALRSFSALFGVLLVPLVFLIGNSADAKGLGLIAAGWIAMHPFQIWYSQEIRMYTMAAFLAASAMFFIIRLADHPFSFSHWSGFILSLSALMYTQYYAFLLIVSFTFAAADIALHLPPDQKRKFIRCTALAAGVILLLFIPWLPVFFRDYAHAETNIGFPDYFHPAITPLFLFIKMLVFGNESYLKDYSWILPLPLILGALALFSTIQLMKKLKFRILLYGTIAPLIIVYLGQIAGLHLYKSHPFIIFHAFFICLVSAGLMQLPRWPRRIAIACLSAASVWVLSTLVLSGPFVKPRISETVEWIETHYRDQDTVAVLPAFIPNPLPEVGDMLSFRYHSKEKFRTVYLTGDTVDEIRRKVEEAVPDNGVLYLVYQINDQMNRNLEKLRSWITDPYRITQEKVLVSRMRGFSIGIDRIEKQKKATDAENNQL